MKRITILLLCIFLFTGCTVVRIDTKSIDNILSVVLSKNNKIYNRVGKGYKYYVPRGVTYMDTDDLNDVLYSDGNYYYVYIDAVSYYYKKEVPYEENNTSYYSKKIEGKKTGYLEINRLKNGKYKIDFVYNYAKIEAIVNKEDINKVVLNSTYILSTVKFNNKIISLMLKEDYFTNKEEKYERFISNSKIDKKVIETN